MGLRDEKGLKPGWSCSGTAWLLEVLRPHQPLLGGRVPSSCASRCGAAPARLSHSVQCTLPVPFALNHCEAKSPLPEPSRPAAGRGRLAALPVLPQLFRGRVPHHRRPPARGLRRHSRAFSRPGGERRAVAAPRRPSRHLHALRVLAAPRRGQSARSRPPRPPPGGSAAPRFAPCRGALPPGPPAAPQGRAAPPRPAPLPLPAPRRWKAVPGPAAGLRGAGAAGGWQRARCPRCQAARAPRC